MAGVCVHICGSSWEGEWCLGWRDTRAGTALRVWPGRRWMGPLASTQRRYGDLQRKAQVVTEPLLVGDVQADFHPRR